jgi:LmbE family N-acetylglucosaminyl deacetylase
VSLTLVISPHLDDAVLSVGGAIAAWTAAGDRVVIATVFTDGPPLEEITPAMRAWADFPARRAEDARACATLGAEARWLGHVERAFRRPFLSARACFTTPTDRAGFVTLPAVTATLAALDALAPDRVLAPLGVGNHVDHVEVMIATSDWALARGWRDRLAFYEDFYALSTTMRRAHPIARQRSWARWRSPLLRAPRLAAVLGSIALARRGPDAARFVAPQLTGARWSVVATPIDEERQLAAIAEYASQATVFGGMRGITAALRAYHRWWCGEPLWRAG